MVSVHVIVPCGVSSLPQRGQVFTGSLKYPGSFWKTEDSADTQTFSLELYWPRACVFGVEERRFRRLRDTELSLHPHLAAGPRGQRSVRDVVRVRAACRACWPHTPAPALRVREPLSVRKEQTPQDRTIPTREAAMLLSLLPAANLPSAPGNPFVFPLPPVPSLPRARSDFTAPWKMNLF